MVRHHIEATKLEHYFKPQSFDTIIFQFPNVGSRDAKYAHNPNHVLIRNFLRSAKPFLKKHAQIFITAVDSPHYHGAFQFDEAAKFARCKVPQSYSFDPSLFSGYSHTNTNDEDSALDKHHKFATWIFRPET